MSYTNGKTLLNILKPKTGTAPPFGAIPFDEMIFNSLKSSPTISESSEPKVLILCGPSGSGKSTVKTLLLSQIGITEYINVDPDEIRTILMGQGVTFSDGKTMAGVTNAFNKRMYDEAQKHKLNIVFDTTGQNFRAVSDLIYTSKQEQYKSYFSIIWASLETCLRRVNGRNTYLKETHSGRVELPISIAEDIYNGFVQPKGTASMYLLDYPVKTHELFICNNNIDGVKPELLYHKVGSNVEFSTNFTGFYNMNLHDKEPYITKETSGGKRRKKTKKNRRKKSKRTRRL
jgi:predicted kinase